VPGPGRIGIERLEGVGVVSLIGEHDLATVSELSATLTATVREHAQVVIDLSQTQFLDSSVLHAIVRAATAADEQHGRLVLQLGTTSIVERVLEVSGLLEMIPRAHGRQQAIQMVTLRRRTSELGPRSSADSAAARRD
jgi:anti-anti-sigma factor